MGVANLSDKDRQSQVVALSTGGKLEEKAANPRRFPNSIIEATVFGVKSNNGKEELEDHICNAADFFF